MVRLPAVYFVRPKAVRNVVQSADDIEIAVLDHRDRLARARVARGEQRIQIVDGGKITRRNRVVGGPARSKRVVGMLARLAASSDAAKSRAKKRCPTRRAPAPPGSAGIAHVGDVLNAVHFEVMNLGVERSRTWPAVPGEIDRHAARTRPRRP